MSQTYTPSREIYNILVRICGVTSAIKVLEELGGQTIYVPKLEGIVQQQRDINIRNAYDSGEASVKSLAKEYNLTETRIRQILKDR